MSCAFHGAGQPHATLFTRPFLNFFVGGSGLRDYVNRVGSGVPRGVLRVLEHPHQL